MAEPDPMDRLHERTNERTNESLTSTTKHHTNDPTHFNPHTFDTTPNSGAGGPSRCGKCTAWP